jgi:hypothetical protein
MRLDASIFDVWVFRSSERDVEYLLLHTSRYKADRYFNGGRFWQIPSASVRDSEKIVPAIERSLNGFGITARAIWAAEHSYTIYNRRFETMQIIGVYAAEANSGEVRLDPEEHAEHRWCAFDEALALVTYRGLKDGLRSVREYVTGRAVPPPELQLK